MNAEQLAAIEAELKKDLEAVSRVRRLLEGKQSASPEPTTEAGSTAEDLESPVSSLRGTIERTMNADPQAKWTVQKMLSHLQQTGYPLKAQKPLYSVGQSMKILVDRGRIRLVRKGVGSAPNVYKGIPRETSGNVAPDQEDSALNLNLQLQ
jgi:hypothetical protein